MSITEFLLARIVEDEANSRRYLSVLPDGDMAPLLRRMLAECEAKRKIVEEHQMWQPTGYRFTDGRQIDVCTVDEQNWPCRTMKALVSVYGDRPDCDPAWTITV